MMLLDLTKLKQETLIDIVCNVYGEANCIEETVNVVGGSSRKEYTIRVENKQVSCVAFSPEKAWLYAAQIAIHLCFGVKQ